MQARHLNNSVQHLVTRVVLPLVALGCSLAAHAAEGPEPDTSLSYNIGVVSDYRVRGIDQTSSKPALQGGVDFTMKSGPYLGLAASNVKWLKDVNGATQGNYEVDLYGGYRAQITDTKFSYDVGVIAYRYPGNNSGIGGVLPAGTFTNANTTEVYGALTYRIYTFKYNYSIGDFLGNLNSKGSQYFDLSAAIDLTNGFTLTPHVGRQLIPGQGHQGDYSDIALTLSKDFGSGVSGSVAAMANNANKPFYTDTLGHFFADNTVVVGVKYTF